MMLKRGSVSEIGIGIFLLVMVVGIIIGLTGFDKVEASHQGVMVRFGEIKGTMAQRPWKHPMR